VAIETIEEDPDAWACLITDYDMPEMTGGALITHLSRTAPEVPVIVVSALARRLTDKALTNAIAVLQKPVNKDKLLEAVRRATTMSTKPEATE
jgi:FixJ family two-component response regulator